jgi:hypothetical protein
MHQPVAEAVAEALEATKAPLHNNNPVKNVIKKQK